MRPLFRSTAGNGSPFLSQFSEVMTGAGPSGTQLKLAANVTRAVRFSGVALNDGGTVDMPIQLEKSNK